MSRKIIAGLDIGTTKVCILLAEMVNNTPNIISVGEAPSEGLARGLVANINRTAEAVKTAMTNALEGTDITDEEIKNMYLYAGVAGEHINAMTHVNYVTIRNSEHEITVEDLERLRSDIKLIEHPADKKILHIIPIDYIIDGVNGFDDPIGNTGKKLEAYSHIVFAATAALNNIKRSVERAGYNVNEFKLQPLASSISVLDDSEKELGVCVIDIGGGTTDIAVYVNKRIRDTSVVGVAGNQVTYDIRETLSIINSDAEKIKKQYGYATDEAIIRMNEEIFINRTGGRGMIKVPVTFLTQIIKARMEELFSIIDSDLSRKGLKEKLTGGIVLTGGGSLLRGCTELAQSVFGLSTRIGIPNYLPAHLARPEYATVAGLILPFPGSNYDLKSNNSIKQETNNTTQNKKSNKIENNIDESKERKVKMPFDLVDKAKGYLNKFKEFLNDI